MKWVKRILLGLLGLLVLALGLGAGYEILGRRRAAREFPAPGRLVDIGGRKMQIDCRGSGSPIVVLESGLDMNGSLPWALVHDSIAATTRTCAYSRAGIMWSDDKPGPHNAVGVAADLKATLDAAGERGPYVMVGHSLGGPYIMTFTKMHPADVVGLVFVDASHPEQVARFRAVVGDKVEPSMATYRFAASLAWTGLVRMATSGTRSDKLPAAVQAAMNAYAATSLGPMLAEQEGMTATMEEAGTFRQLGDRPLVVLTAMAPMDTASLKTLKMDTTDAAKFQQVWNTLHEEEASWSTRGERIVLPDGSHYVQLDRPDVVIASVRRVVGMVRPVSAQGLPGYPVVQAWRDCAPWDGAALSVVFSAAGSTADAVLPPYLTVSLWKGREQLEGQTWQWSTAQDVGAASLCRKEQECEAATAGTVTIDRRLVDSLVTGQLKLDFPNRTPIEGSFRAAWRQKMILCG